jgi:hypothetical protein
MRLPSRIVALCAALVCSASSVGAQYQTRTWLDWRTIEAGHFAFHYPVELESWARNVAGKMAGVDTGVSRLVGFRPTQKIDVVMDDPFRIPNGSAWPLLDEPALVLWATPPSPREDIGNYVSWADMLATHEYAHLAHLLRPSRNQWQSLLWKLAPVELGPISRKAPRWAIEGYATYIEGRITGSGRPNGMWRSTILRQWALEGALPTYAQLNAMGGMYGGDFAYLAGSAFMEWLVQPQPEAFDALWRRMSARTDRGFAEAFAGVYGEPPDVLYGRFAAQLTADAFEAAARTRRSRADSGVMVQHLARETGDPAISADGGRAAIMLASATRPGRVVIWSTVPEPDTVAARAAKALLARDPGDVAAVRKFPPAKRVRATLHAVGNQPYQDPRFFRDGRVLVWRNTARGDGSWAPDLYVWDPQRRTVKRLTRGANLRQGDPSPDGSMFAATRCAAGRCDLAFVDARTGEATIIAEGNDRRSFHRPRFSPNGRALVVSVRDEGFWRLAIVNVADRSLRVITSGTSNWFDAAFSNDTTLVASSDESGVLNVVRLRADGAPMGRITSVTGAAVAPEPNPADGSVWFLSLHARGWDVRSAPGAAVVETNVATRPPPRPVALPTAPVPPATRYTPDRKWVYFPGVVATREGTSAILGLANTDPVGRNEVLIQLGLSATSGPGSASWQGGTAALTTRTRIPWTVSSFYIAQEGDRWRELRGMSASAEFARRFESRAFRAMLVGTAGDARTDYIAPSGWKKRNLVYGEMAGSVVRHRNGLRTTASARLSGAAGNHGSADIGHFLATASLASTEIPLVLSGAIGTSSSDHFGEQFTIGGHPPTMLPPGIMSQMITMPALPPAFVGKRLETYRIGIPFYGLQLYGWGGRAWNGKRPPFETVLGAEWSGSIAQISALGTPAARVTAGIGYWKNRGTGARPYFDNLLYYNPSRSATQAYLLTQFGDWAR